MENSVEVSLKIELPYDLHLGIKPEKTTIHKDTWTTGFVAASFIYTTSMTWKQCRRPSTEKWRKKMWYIYIYNGILLSHKKKCYWVISEDVDGPRV